MQRLRSGTLSNLMAPILLATLALAGCGNRIAQIDGLPQTTDVSGEPWPVLVDTPAQPSDTLLPETGARTLINLENAQAISLERQASAGQPRINATVLQDRVERIKTRTDINDVGIDAAALSARADRLSQMRRLPANAVATDDLRARAQRIAEATRQSGASGIDLDLRARGQRVATIGAQNYGRVDSVALLARAARVRSQSVGNTSEKLDATVPGFQITEQGALVDPVVEPLIKPTRASEAALRRKGRDTSVVSGDFRNKAREAVERARRRAATPPPE